MARQGTAKNELQSEPRLWKPNPGTKNACFELVSGASGQNDFPVQLICAPAPAPPQPRGWGVRCWNSISDLVQMMRLVDPPHLNMTVQDIDLVDATRMLRKTPIRRQRLIEELKKQGPVYAVMTD
jgi:hypothetical protein